MVGWERQVGLCVSLVDSALTRAWVGSLRKRQENWRCCRSLELRSAGSSGRIRAIGVHRGAAGASENARRRKQASFLHVRRSCAR